MDTTQGPSGELYRHNGDFSGDVLTTVVVGDAFTEGAEQVEVRIPFEDMLHLVLTHFRSKAISFLEQADDATLEKFFTNWSAK